jgi:hypothetical protein
VPAPEGVTEGGAASTDGGNKLVSKIAQETSKAHDDLVRGRSNWTAIRDARRRVATLRCKSVLYPSSAVAKSEIESRFNAVQRSPRTLRPGRRYVK